MFSCIALPCLRRNGYTRFVGDREAEVADRAARPGHVRLLEPQSEPAKDFGVGWGCLWGAPSATLKICRLSCNPLWSLHIYIDLLCKRIKQVGFVQAFFSIAVSFPIT